MCLRLVAPHMLAPSVFGLRRFTPTSIGQNSPAMIRSQPALRESAAGHPDAHSLTVFSLVQVGTRNRRVEIPRSSS